MLALSKSQTDEPTERLRLQDGHRSREWEFGWGCWIAHASNFHKRTHNCGDGQCAQVNQFPTGSVRCSIPVSYVQRSQHLIQRPCSQDFAVFGQELKLSFLPSYARRREALTTVESISKSVGLSLWFIFHSTIAIMWEFMVWINVRRCNEESISLHHRLVVIVAQLARRWFRVQESLGGADWTVWTFIAQLKHCYSFHLQQNKNNTNVRYLSSQLLSTDSQRVCGLSWKIDKLWSMLADFKRRKCDKSFLGLKVGCFATKHKHKQGQNLLWAENAKTRPFILSLVLMLLLRFCLWLQVLFHCTTGSSFWMGVQTA